MVVNFWLYKFCVFQQSYSKFWDFSMWNWSQSFCVNHQLETSRTKTRNFDMIVYETIPKFFLSEIWKSVFIYFYIVRGILQTADTFLLVAVSIERYKAICRPITPKHPAYLYLIAVMFLSLSLEIPRFFELELDRQSNIWPSLLFENIEYIRINSFWNELLVSKFCL